jgi:hypothetical protein
LRTTVLELPDLLKTDCFYVEACGKLRGAKKKERSQKIARVRLSKASAYLRLLEGGDPPGHLHIDIALTRFFPKARPSVNSSRSAIGSDVSRHFGQALDVLIFAQFITLVEDIQAGSGVVFGGPSAVVSTVNNTTIEVGGAHLLLRNDNFVRTIDWQLYKGDSVFVDISARCEVTVSPSYLTDIVDRLHTAYETYIIGRTVDASA